MQNRELLDNAVINFKIVMLIAESKPVEGAKLLGDIIALRFKRHSETMRIESAIRAVLLAVLLGIFFGSTTFEWTHMILLVLYVAWVFAAFREHKRVHDLRDRLLSMLNNFNTINFEVIDKLDNVRIHIKFETKLVECEDKYKPTLDDMLLQFIAVLKKSYYRKASGVGNAV